jgi:small-conductance mechanosensitive channel
MRLFLVRDALDLVYLGNPLRAWLTAAGVLGGVFGALLLARHLLTRRLERIAPRTATELDDLALGAVRRTSTLFLLALAIAAARKALFDLPQDVKDAVALVAKLAFYVQAARWGYGAVAFWLARTTRQRTETDKASLATLNLLGIAARIAIAVLVVLLALDAFGVNITALVTGLGIAGVAVALAVQNVLGDLLASLSIALDKPFVVGDTITFDTFVGTVESVGLKTTRLRSITGERIVVSNAELLKARIRNFQGMVERRVVLTLNLPLHTPPAAVARVPGLVREIIEAETDARFDRSHFAAITDQALAVETVYFVTSGDYRLFMDLQERVNLAVLERLTAAGLGLTLPTRAVVVRPGADGANGSTPPVPFATSVAAAGGATDP